MLIGFVRTFPVFSARKAKNRRQPRKMTHYINRYVWTWNGSEWNSGSVDKQTGMSNNCSEEVEIRVPPVSVQAVWRRPPVTFRPAEISESAIWSRAAYHSAASLRLTWQLWHTPERNTWTLKVQSLSFKTPSFISASGCITAVNKLLTLSDVHISLWWVELNHSWIYFLLIRCLRFSVAATGVWRFDWWYLNSSIDTC